MFCPSCQMERVASPTDPNIRRLRVDDDGILEIRVRLRDLCGECGMDLRVGEIEWKVDVKNSLKGHLGIKKHKIQAEDRGYRRKGTDGVTVSYVIGCSCGKLAELTGTLEGTVVLEPVKSE